MGAQLLPGVSSAPARAKGSATPAVLFPPLPTEVEGLPSELCLRISLPGLAPEQVFRAWVEPHLLTQWWPTEAEVDPRVGGTYRFSWPRQGWHLRGVYREIRPSKRLVFTWRWDHDPDLLKLVEVDLLRGADGGTLLTVTHGPYDGSERDTELRASHKEGWQYFLGRLATLAPP
jgi:uncharacterized protein YndB with AHSA1/START domain